LVDPAALRHLGQAEPRRLALAPEPGPGPAHTLPAPAPLGPAAAPTRPPRPRRGTPREKKCPGPVTPPDRAVWGGRRTGQAPPDDRRRCSASTGENAGPEVPSRPGAPSGRAGAGEPGGAVPRTAAAPFPSHHAE
jgi:hypothetical protein